jgi:DNA polymerase-3 subunit gamma/tau
VRQIKDEVLFPPNSSRHKIYIIDEVHMLSMSAFNALLKTIEEPPPYVVFIFATTELHQVPATIKSRCQQFHFRLVSVEQIKGLLSDAASELGFQAEDEALYWVARQATGSIRDAYTLFDQVAAFSEGRLTYDKIRDKLGLVGTDRLNALCELCAAGKPAEALEALDAVFEAGVQAEQFVADMADYLRTLLFIKAGVTKEALLGQGVERFSGAVLAAWSVSALERALSFFLDLYRDLRYSLSPRTEVDLALSRLCILSSWVSPEELRAAVEETRALLGGSAPPPGGTPPAAGGGFASPPGAPLWPAPAPASPPPGTGAAPAAGVSATQGTAPAGNAAAPPAPGAPATPAPGVPMGQAMTAAFLARRQAGGHGAAPAARAPAPGAPEAQSTPAVPVGVGAAATPGTEYGVAGNEGSAGEGEGEAPLLPQAEIVKNLFKGSVV